FDLLDPNGLRRGRAELLADDAGSLHAPRQTAPVVVEGRTDFHRRDADAELLLLGDLLDGSRWTDLPAKDARVLAVADPRDEDRRPEALDTSLEHRGVQRVVRADLHALGAADAALQERALLDCTGRPDH